MARTKAAQFPDVKWSKNKFEITIKLLEIVQQRSLLGGWPNFAMGVEESQELAWLLLGSRPVYRDCFRRDPGLAKATYGQRIRDRTHQIETQFYGNGPTGESWRARAWPDRVVELLNVLMGDTEVPSQPSIAGGSNAVISGGGGPVVGGESDSNNGETDLGQPPSSRRTTIAGPAACDPPSTGSTVNDVSQYDPRLFDLPQQDQSVPHPKDHVPRPVVSAFGPRRQISPLSIRRNATGKKRLRDDSDEDIERVEREEEVKPAASKDGRKYPGGEYSPRAKRPKLHRYSAGF